MSDAVGSGRRTLYPEIEPYESGMLEVGDGHTLYWERVGTPGAKPAVMLHGGPGAGCNANHRRQWDPARYDVLLFDQRGCGRSTPFASLEANTTWHIVADMERLREMCGWDKWQVFGGSWGSTLALSYAGTHPERCSELILRGIFLSGRKELEWLTKYGASELYPEQWEAFLAHVGGTQGEDMIEPYWALLDDPDPAVRRSAAAAWNRWEGVTCTLLPQAETVDNMAEGDNAVAKHLLIFQTKVGGPVGDKAVQLDEAAFVQQEVEPLPGGKLSLGVLRLDSRFAATEFRLCPLSLQQIKLLSH